MLISEVIQIRSKLNERIIKLDAILTKLGGKTYTLVIWHPSDQFWTLSQLLEDHAWVAAQQSMKNMSIVLVYVGVVCAA